MTINKKSFNDIFNDFEKVKEYAIYSFENLKKCADNAEVIRFGTESIGLGLLYPKIRRKICKGQYGKWIRTAKDSMVYYTIYEFKSDMTPLRIRHMHNEKCIETFYFFELEDKIYAIPFIGDTSNFFISVNAYLFFYQNSQLKRFVAFDNYRVNLLEFDYSKYPHVSLIKHDYIKRLFDSGTQYKKWMWEYDENSNGKIINLRPM